MMNSQATVDDDLANQYSDEPDDLPYNVELSSIDLEVLSSLMETMQLEALTPM